MTIEEMRKAVLELYPYKKWIDRVTAMSDSQIFVIYTRLKNENKL